MLKKTFSAISILFFLIACEQKQDVPDRSLEYYEVKEAFIIDVLSKEDSKFIVADTIQYLVGEEALKAFRKDHGKELEESTFYIRNTENKTIQLPLSDTVKIIAQTLENNQDGGFKINAELTIDKFIDLYKVESKHDLSVIPFRIHLSGDKVVQIKEIYIP